MHFKVITGSFRRNFFLSTSWPRPLVYSVISRRYCPRQFNTDSSSYSSDTNGLDLDQNIALYGRQDTSPNDIQAEGTKETLDSCAGGEERNNDVLNIVNNEITAQVEENKKGDSEQSQKDEIRTKATLSQFIILDPKKSHLVPRQQRRRRGDGQSKEIVTQDLLKYDSQARFGEKFEPLSAIFEKIDTAKPKNQVISKKKFQQLSNDLSKAYLKSQLQEYVAERAGISTKTKTKRACIKYILEEYWKLTISSDIEESSDVIVEKSIKLTKQEMFMVVSRNGRLPRIWTKAGARITISGQNQEIIVCSTADTFDWILASLHRFLRGMRSETIDLKPINALCPVNSLPLSHIQRFSDTFIDLDDENDGSMKLSARSLDSIEHAKRLIIHSTNWIPRTFNGYIYDTNPRNITSSWYSRIVDDDALLWNERGRPWYRWKNVKATLPSQKHQDALFVQRPAYSNEIAGPRQMKMLNGDIKSVESMVNFSSSSTVNNDFQSVSSGDSDLHTIADNLVNGCLAQINMQNGDDSDPVTFLATFGHVLHSKDFGQGKLPFSSCNKAFSTNVPFIHKKVGLLPSSKDLDHDFNAMPLSSEESDSAFFESKSDPWNDLIKQADSYMSNNKTVVANKNSVAKDNHAFLVQLKFLPHPLLNRDIDIKQLPPIEAWFEFDKNDQCDKDNVTLLSCEQESNMFVSIPDKEADIKYSVTRARFMDSQQESFKNFVNDCQVDISDEKPIKVPNSFQLDIDGNKVVYMYQTMVYRRQIDLKFDNFILQLSSIEGGLFGGRKQEATLVLDYPDGESQIDKAQVKDFIVKSLEFLKDF